MQEVKYYTPEIEEFHLGFEYEYKSDFYMEILEKTSGEWKKEECYFSVSQDGESEFNDIQKLIKKGGIRVKYIDKQDILDCEFKFQCLDSFGQLIFKRGSFELTFYPPNPTFIEIDNSDKNFTRFIGRIKNKTELKKLLKQLEIDGTN